MQNKNTSNNDEAAFSPQDKVQELEKALSAREIEIKKLNRQIKSLNLLFDRYKQVKEATARMGGAISLNRSKEEKYMDMLISNCPVIIIIFDSYGRVAYCTDAFLKAANIPNVGIISGRTFKEVYSYFADEALISRLEAAFDKSDKENQTITIDEVIDIGKNNNPRNFSIQSTVVKNDKGELAGSLLMFHDLTDLVRAKEEAVQASNAKSDFLATVSHEIRTPMNAIIGITDILKKTHDEKKQKAHLRNIENSSQMLLSLINDILDFSKIEAGKLELINEFFDFKIFLNHIQSIFQVMFTQKDIRFVCNFSDNLPAVVCSDQNRLNQILTNLLNNALKYTPEGTVTFSVDCNSEGACRFEIKDSGIGIKEDDLPRLFKAFEQVDRVKNKKTVGTGLGLAITKRLTELMGGEVSVKSEYGKGSCFSILLKLPVGKETDINKEEVKCYTFSAPKAKVLLVDDIDINLIVASAMLEEYQIVPDTALNGLEALKMIKNKDYDLVLMDHMMPEMDGVEATAEIRSLGGKYANLHIVALTANAVSGAKEMFLENGFDGFLSKPINKQELSSVLVKWLPSDLIENLEK